MKHKKILKFSATLLACAISFSFVSMAYAQTGGLVPCTDNCTFSSLITLISNVLQFMLFLAAFVATLLFAYAGFQYVFAAGDQGKIKKAHQIFWTTFIGLVFMASAWLIVKLIVDTLGSGAGAQFLGGIR